MLLALYGVVVTFGPAVKFQILYELMQLHGVHFVVENKKISKASSASGISGAKENNSPGFANILAGNKEQVLIPIDPLFSILIPKLGIDEQIVPNVDPENPNVYLPVLTHAVAHAKGSVFPGDPGIVYLFAHSADNWWDIEQYNAIFYTLDDLTKGDEIDIFYKNRRYIYTVSQKLISDPQNVAYLTSPHTGPQRLVLQTCWPPGTSWKRLYILAIPRQVSHSRS